MPLSHGDLKLDVFRLLAWSICMPALACWPFLSAMPAFTLMGSGLSTLQIVVNALLLITGFWPIATACVFYLLVRVAPAAIGKRPAGDRGLLLGAFAAIWTGVYLIAALAIG